MAELKMGKVEMKQVLEKVDTTIDQYDLTDQEEIKLRLLAEETVSMAKQLFGERDAVVIIRKEPHAFAVCYRTKTRLTAEEKADLLDFSTKKENSKTKTFSGKIAFITDYLFNAPVDMNLGIGIYNAGPMASYDITWSMSNMNKAVKQEEWDQYEKAIILKYADDIIVGVLGNDVELVVKMNLSK